MKEKLETRGTVLIIDDDVLPMMFYVWALEKEGFKVRQCYGPDTALEFVEKEGANIALLILDIMMLPGKRYRDEDTDEGLRTGVFLYKDFKALYPHVPVIVLTNVSNQETLKQFQKGPWLKMVQKLDCPPFELAELASEMIEASAK